MEKLYRIKESTLRNLTESVKNITGKTEEVIVVGNISNEINYKAEKLDNEITAQNTLISEQDAKIAELAEVLSGKAGGSEPTLQEKTVSPSTSKQTVTADSGYDGLSQVTVNAMSTATQATPSISVSSSGLITASATQTPGYVAAGTKSATKQLTTKAATTYTPTASNQTIAAGTYLIGTQTIKGDANLVASNIKKGVSIFGVNGTLEEGNGGSSLTYKYGNLTYTVSKMYEPGFDLYTFVIDDSSIDLTKCADVIVEFISSKYQNFGVSDKNIHRIVTLSNLGLRKGGGSTNEDYCGFTGIKSVGNNNILILRDASNDKYIKDFVYYASC